ncbi:energy transducer TonB [Flavobacterium artemisiae]|uniref:Energy transducer TonB n=1 Tax=Flavobacterium artemisiae TaxID=2126556 RepID=A0ABW4HEI2_9FLAO
MNVCFRPIAKFSQRVIVFIIIAFVNYGFSQASVQKKIVKEGPNFKLFNEVEVKPEFEGGVNNFYKYIGYNFKRHENELYGEIKAFFIIETDGSVSDIEIIKNDLGNIAEKELIRILKNCPKWIPGYEKGIPVRVKSVIPIKLEKPK